MHAATEACPIELPRGATAAATTPRIDESDRELLCRYVRDGSHAAFARLVERHVNLVYAAVRRQLRGDATAQAEDVVQAVFILLARKARTLGPHVSLPGWLYNAARMTAANARRAAERRRHYEHEAGEAMRQRLRDDAASSVDDDAAVEWREIEPAIDDALARLRPRDREAIVMRFLSAKTTREIGDAIGLTEDAARVRVNRALARLRRLLGVTAPVAALAAALDAGAAHAAAVAPAHLAAAIVPAALSPAAAASSAATTLAGATAAGLAPVNLKLATVALAAVVFAGAGTAGVVVAVQSTGKSRTTAAAPPSAAPPAAIAPAVGGAATMPPMPPNVPANSPRGVTLRIVAAAAAGDRRTVRDLLIVC